MSAPESYWSYSRLTTYLSCSLAYFFRYLSDEKPESVSANLLLGSGVHYGHELIYRGMMNGGIPNLDDILDEVSEDIVLREKLNPPILFSNGNDLDDLISEARRLTECLFRSVSPEKVVAVDLEETVPILDYGKPLGTPLKVIYDLIVEGDDGEEIVVDLKTTRCRFQQPKLDWDLQPTCYLYARGISGGNGKRRSFRYDCLLKKKEPEFVQYPANRGKADFQRMVSIVKTVSDGIKHGIFIPNRGSYFCGTCEWEKACRDWKG